MSAVKVLRCPIRYQFAAIKAGAKTHSIWRGAILAVREPHKPHWFTHTKATLEVSRALLMKTCARQRVHNKARRAEYHPHPPPPPASASSRVPSMMIKAWAESGNQRSASACLCLSPFNESLAIQGIYRHEGDWMRPLPSPPCITTLILSMFWSCWSVIFFLRT